MDIQHGEITFRVHPDRTNCGSVCTIAIDACPVDRPAAGATPYNPTKEYGIIAVVRNMGGWRHNDGRDDGWGQYGGSLQTTLVPIHSPAGVRCGEFLIADQLCSGMYGEHDAHDGMGRAVLAYCKAPQVCHDANEAIEAAIKSGIVLAIPNEGGGRREIVIDNINY